MSSKLKKAIGAVKDQTSISLAKVSNNTSSNLEVAVLKATSHDAVPMDDKYLHEILHLVSSNKTHAAACARAIGKRIGRTRNWVVALKSLMLVLRIFQDGDPYFPREVLHAMKRGAKILNLSSFRDDSNSSPWDFTSFIRTFALYLDERLECFLTGKLQRRYMHERSGSSSVYQRSKSRGTLRPNELVRDMKPAMLLDKMCNWQRLLDRAIATRPTGAAKTNHLVHISLYAIVQESFDLYKDISDGLALVLDSFFHLQYQNCVTAFQTCIKAVKQFEELSAFYTLCKSLGVGRSSEYPSVQVISEELIETLQEFLKDQSSFPSHAKPANRLLIGPASPSSVRPRSNRHDSYSGQSDFSSPTLSGLSDRTSEFGSQCPSLEDLISATETGISPAISIDLEAYPASQRDDAFRVSDTGSSRSLPVTSSVVDLMSLDDWTEHNEKEEKDDENGQEKQKQKGVLDSSASKNWEIVLAETISSPLPALSKPPSDNNTDTLEAFPAQPTPSSALPQPLPDINTNTFDAFPTQPTSTVLSQPLSGNNTNTFDVFPHQLLSSALSQPLSDNNPNIFNAFPEQPPAKEENTSTAAARWDLVLFEAAPPPPPQATPNIQIPPNNHYNPFLMDPFELPELSNQQLAISAPTFQATPTFSVQNPSQTPFGVQNENDPFASGAQFSGEKMFSSPMDQQNLQHEQQLWLQNQNKIIAKYWT